MSPIPTAAKLVGSVRLGGIVARTPHPSSPGPPNGGPQMVEISRDDRRAHHTSSLYRA